MSVYATDPAARIDAVKELRRLADKAAAGVIERGAISELLSGKSSEPRLVFQPWYSSIKGDSEQKTLYSDLEEILIKLASLTLQGAKRLPTEEVKEIGRRLEVLAERIGAGLTAVGEAKSKSRGDISEDTPKKPQKALRRIRVEHVDCDRIYEDAKKKGFPLTQAQVVQDYLDENPKCKLTPAALLKGWGAYRGKQRKKDT